MGGPIVRTGTTPEYWKNWDQVFGNSTDKKKTTKKKTAAKAVKKTAKKATKAKKKKS